jgi:hypothetical protein
LALSKLLKEEKRLSTPWKFGAKRDLFWGRRTASLTRDWLLVEIRAESQDWGALFEEEKNGATREVCRLLNGSGDKIKVPLLSLRWETSWAG